MNNNEFQSSEEISKAANDGFKPVKFDGTPAAPEELPSKPASDTAGVVVPPVSYASPFTPPVVPVPPAGPYPPNAAYAPQGAYTQNFVPSFQPARPAPVGFKDLAGISKAIIIIGVIMLVFSVLGVILSGFLVKHLSNMELFLKLQENISFSYSPVGIPTSTLRIAYNILVCIFLYRSNQNLFFLGCPNKKYSAGWALAWYLLPFVNLVMPFFVIREIWEGSKLGYYTWSSRGEPLPEKPSSAPVLFWILMKWASGIVAFFTLTNAIFVGIRGAASGLSMAEMFGRMNILLPVLVSMVCEITFIIIVGRIAKEQKEKYDVAQEFYMKQKTVG